MKRSRTRKQDQDFDRKQEAMRRIQGVEHIFVADAAVYVRDTLDLAFVAARSVDHNATLDHALAVYDRINAERHRRLQEAEADATSSRGDATSSRGGSGSTSS